MQLNEMRENECTLQHLGKPQKSTNGQAINGHRNFSLQKVFFFSLMARPLQSPS